MNYTMALRLCDDDGMVGNERCDPQPGPFLNLTYLEMFNNMTTHADYRAGGRVAEPFHCTGSAHIGGHHIACTSPAHAVIACMSCGPVYPPAGQARGLCARCRPIVAATATTSNTRVAQALGIPVGPSPAVLPEKP